MSIQSYILYADDDSDDQAILKECMRRAAPATDLYCFENGLLLFRYLEDLTPGALLPACIVLDMNMPVWTGLETLAALKHEPCYQSIPAFIFSTAPEEAEKKGTGLPGAEAYIAKPYAQTDLFKVCQEFAEYANGRTRLKDVPYKTSLH